MFQQMTFQYYLGDELDAEDKKVLERYKNFNGTENNSPIVTDANADFTPSGSNLPDNEDLNKDNTISDLEEYYEYELNLEPGRLEVGQNYIIDKVPANGDEGAFWYQFRIPIRQPTRVQGNISGFKSIRFIRMYATEFQQPVVLRLVKFQLVGSQWRKFDLGIYISEGFMKFQSLMMPGSMFQLLISRRMEAQTMQMKAYLMCCLLGLNVILITLPRLSGSRTNNLYCFLSET